MDRLLFDFKHAIDRHHFERPPIEHDVMAFEKVKLLLQLIGTLCILFGMGPVIVTSFYRKGNPKSYHSLLQAFDIRSKDKPALFRPLMCGLQAILKVVDPHLQIYMHDELVGKPQEHIHLAYKNGATK